MIDGKIKKIMYFSLISLSFISFIIVFLTNDYSNCSFLCLLPLFFFIGVLLFSLVNKKNDLYFYSYGFNPYIYVFWQLFRLQRFLFTI